MNGERKCKAAERPRGFRITAPDRVPVDVELIGDQFVVSSPRRPGGRQIGLGAQGGAVGLYEGWALVDLCDKRATRGDCFLFHVEYAGEAATIEIRPAGLVAQARGQKKTKNGPARWGANQLGKWARGWGANL